MEILILTPDLIKNSQCDAVVIDTCIIMRYDEKICNELLHKMNIYISPTAYAECINVSPEARKFLENCKIKYPSAESLFHESRCVNHADLEGVQLAYEYDIPFITLDYRAIRGVNSQMCKIITCSNVPVHIMTIWTNYIPPNNISETKTLEGYAKVSNVCSISCLHPYSYYHENQYASGYKCGMCKKKLFEKIESEPRKLKDTIAYKMKDANCHHPVVNRIHKDAYVKCIFCKKSIDNDRQTYTCSCEHIFSAKKCVLCGKSKIEM